MDNPGKTPLQEALAMVRQRRKKSAECARMEATRCDVLQEVEGILEDWAETEERASAASAAAKGAVGGASCTETNGEE